MIGLGTLINIVAILVGSTIGVALGHRLPQRTRDVVTDGLGLVTLLVAALSTAAILDAAVEPAVGAAGVLIVLGSTLFAITLLAASALWRDAEGIIPFDSFARVGDTIFGGAVVTVAALLAVRAVLRDREIQ